MGTKMVRGVAKEVAKVGAKVVPPTPRGAPQPLL